MPSWQTQQRKGPALYPQADQGDQSYEKRAQHLITDLTCSLKRGRAVSSFKDMSFDSLSRPYGR